MDRCGVAKISKVCQSCGSGWKGMQDTGEGKLGLAKLSEKELCLRRGIGGPPCSA